MTDDEKPGWSKITVRQSVDDIFECGPTLKVGVAAAPFVSGNTTCVLAQIDTGAAGTCISSQLAERLGVKPIDYGTVAQGGRDSLVAPYYKVRLRLPATEIDLDVVGLTSLSPPHDVLIGRDVLASCRLSVDFTTGAMRLHFKPG